MTHFRRPARAPTGGRRQRWPRIVTPGRRRSPSRDERWRPSSGTAEDRNHDQLTCPPIAVTWWRPSSGVAEDRNSNRPSEYFQYGQQVAAILRDGRGSQHCLRQNWRPAAWWTGGRRPRRPRIATRGRRLSAQRTVRWRRCPWRPGIATGSARGKSPTTPVDWRPPSPQAAEDRNMDDAQPDRPTSPRWRPPSAAAEDRNWFGPWQVHLHCRSTGGRRPGWPRIATLRGQV